MDFGEILKLWDAEARSSSGARRGSEEKKNPAAEAQMKWLERYGVPEATAKDEEPEPRLSRRDIDAMPIDASLDLHGMTAREAEAALSAFFATAERSGCRKVLIVHGKGLHSASEPVLEGLVRRWLERKASAGRTGHPDAIDGGRGATWVLLKRTGNQRSR